MPAKVLLTAVEGPMAGTRYRFDEKMLCMIGRAEVCMLKLSGDAEKGVSRHHCLLDIRPPEAFIQDLGSSNGTFVNGLNIGRGPDSPNKPLVTHALMNGDRIRIATNVFEVTLVEALKCHVCHRVLGAEYEKDEYNTNREKIICRDCLEAGLREPMASANKTIKYHVCALCGAALPPDDRNSQYCRECAGARQDMSRTLKIDISSLGGKSNLIQVPGYNVLKLIGRGGMGQVYLAQKKDTLEKVALKILLPEIAANEQCREDFIREAANLKSLTHPNIVALRDCNYAGGSFFITLEYCTEGTLREYIQKNAHPLDLRTALDFTGQILDALSYAHNIRLEQESLLDDQKYTVNGLVHRDIKPENIFLTRTDGNMYAKVADFGLAKAFDMAGISGCTRTGDFSGTLAFIPKQQFINFKYVKPEVDVWAAAATFYYMLTGQPPRDFSTGGVMDVFETTPFPLHRIDPNIPRALSDVVAAALDDHITLRYKTADQLKYALFDAVDKK